MGEFVFNLTDSEIDQVIFSAFDSNKYWISRKDRKRPNELKGTVVTVRPIEDTKPKTKIEIVFDESKIEVSGIDDKIIVSKICHAYNKIVNIKVPQIKKEYDEAESMIDDQLSRLMFEAKQILMDSCYETGELLSTKAVKSRIEVLKYASFIPPEVAKTINHAVFVNLIPNEYNTEDREIEIGGVYWADLNPIVGQEFGGFRPVVAMGFVNSRDLVFCVPLTSKDIQGNYVDSFGEKESYAVADAPKFISKDRIYRKIATLDNDKFKSIVQDVDKSMELYDEIPQQETVKVEETVIEEQTEKIESQPEPEKTTVTEEKKVTNSYVSMEIQEANAQLIEEIKKELVFPTEEEYMKIINERVTHLKKTKKLGFINKGKKSGNVAYSIENDKGCVLIKLNENHQDYSKNIYASTFRINTHDFSVMFENPMLYARGTGKDPWTTEQFQKLMIEKNERFHIYLINHLALTFSLAYNKKVRGKSEEEKLEKLEDDVATLKTMIENLGIIYNGDLNEIVQHGVRSLDLSLCERMDQTENENE